MWLDQKYIGIISTRLEQFSPVRNGKEYIMRCPICGDSRENKHKRRGHIYMNPNGAQYHCYNCDAHTSFANFLKHVDQQVWKDYVKELLSEKAGKKPEKEKTNFTTPKPVFHEAGPLLKLKKISQLDPKHPAKLYVMNRRIPSHYHYKLFYVSKFKKLVNSIIPEKFQEPIENEHPRLIIPYYNKDKKIFGFQGRAFDKHSAKYITIKLDESSHMMYGLDTVDQTKPHFIFEGPIDSMFIPNSVAMSGGDIDWDWCNENSIFVYDNEPRSKETQDKIQKIMRKGYAISLFDAGNKYKDVNEMVMSGMDPDYISKRLTANIARGLEAKLMFTVWRKN